MEAVIFDMDGILFDSEQLCLSCWSEIGEEFNIPGIKHIATECIGTTNLKSEEIFKSHYGKDFPYETYRQMLSNRIMTYVRKKGMPLKQGVFELMDFLKTLGVKIGLASSTRKIRVEEQLKLTGLIEYFDSIVCGDMVSKSKPEPDIFLECARRLQVNKKETYVIEDSYNGIKAASKAEMHPIMVPDLLPPTDEMLELSEEILHNLLEVKSYFERRSYK